MRTATKHWLIVLLVVCLTALLGCSQKTSSGKDTFPNKEIRWVVPYTAGGGFDTIARGVQPALSEVLGVPVVIENIPGAEGYNQVYIAPPDGHTIGMADATGEYATKLVQSPVYDIDKFTWLGRINTGSNLIVASAKSDIADFAALQNKKDTVRIGIFGFSTPTVQSVLLGERLGIKTAFVNFAGPQEVVAGILRGDADVAMIGVPVWLDHIKAGTVVPLAMWSDERTPQLPDVPHLSELGFSDVLAATTHRAVVAPPGVPEEIVEALAKAFTEAMTKESTQKYFTDTVSEQNWLWGKQFDGIAPQINKLMTDHAEQLKGAALQ